MTNVHLSWSVTSHHRLVSDERHSQLFVLLNTSRQLPWEVAADTLSEFSHSHRMLVSGYHAKFRLEVIQAAVVG